DDQSELQFTAPRLAQSRLTLTVPGASHLYAVTRQGMQRVSTEGKEGRLEADLGRVGAPLQIRWHEGADRTPQVQYREAYLWQLQRDAGTPAGVRHAPSSRGATATLAVDLPRDLEVRQAEARRPPARTGAPAEPVTPVRLADWRVTGAADRRQLVLEFAGP